MSTAKGSAVVQVTILLLRFQVRTLSTDRDMWRKVALREQMVLQRKFAKIINQFLRMNSVRLLG
jgi:adenylate kinase